MEDRSIAEGVALGSAEKNSSTGSGGKTTQQSGNRSSSSKTIEAAAADRQTLINCALARSILASNLKDIYHGLNQNGIFVFVLTILGQYWAFRSA